MGTARYKQYIPAIVTLGYFIEAHCSNILGNGELDTAGTEETKVYKRKERRNVELDTAGTNGKTEAIRSGTF